jgi:hypothetical protein
MLYHCFVFPIGQDEIIHVLNLNVVLVTLGGGTAGCRKVVL